MSVTLILVVTVIYIGVSISEIFNHNLGTSVMFLGYAIANFGIIMAMSNPSQ